jgi:hypothetical protein
VLRFSAALGKPGKHAFHYLTAAHADIVFLVLPENPGQGRIYMQYSPFRIDYGDRFLELIEILGES